MRAQGSCVSSQQNTPTGHAAHALAREPGHTTFPCRRSLPGHTGELSPPPSQLPSTPLQASEVLTSARPVDSPRSWPPGGPPPSRAGPDRLQEGLKRAAAWSWELLWAP